MIKSIISIVDLALFIHFENFGTITDDKLLICIFGSLFSVTDLTSYKGSKGLDSQGEQQDFDINDTIINRIDIKKIHRLIDEID